MAYPISDVPRRIVYSGSAGVGPYAFTFEVLVATDIAVYKNTTLLTLTTDYTVSINPVTGTGTVTLVVAATGSDTVTIVGDRAIQRTSDFVTGGDLFANTLNDELDAQVIYTQQVDEKADRAIKAPVTDPTTIDMTLPSSTVRASKALGFTASGNPTQSSSTLAAIDAAVTTVQTLAAASPGSSAGISHIAAGTGAVATTVQTKLRETVSVKDFGAVGDGVADDTVAIQSAIDALEAAGGGELRFPSGTYKITSPLTVAGKVSLVGENLWSTVINKTTNTAGSGSNTARSGTVTDTYAVDAVVILTHEDNGYNYDTQIRNLILKKNSFSASSYGIYAPRCTHFLFAELLILNCQTGYYTFDSWMSNLRNVTVQACAVGYQHADDGTGNGTGTSITFQNCWVNFDNTVDQPTSAFLLFGLTYSSLICCAADNGLRTDGTGIYNYTFETCTGISMNGCGAENFRGGFLRLNAGHVSVTETRTFAAVGVASGTVATVFVDGAAKLTMTGCNFAVPTSPGVIYDWIIQNGSQVVEVNPFASPSGGNTFAGWSGGASRTTITATGTTISDATGSRTLPTKVTGSVSLTAATPATIFTVPTAGVYYLFIYVASSGSSYQSSYLITSDGVTADATALKSGANLTIAMSGLNVRATSAATAGANWTIIQQTQV